MLAGLLKTESSPSSSWQGINYDTHTGRGKKKESKGMTLLLNPNLLGILDQEKAKEISHSPNNSSVTFASDFSRDSKTSMDKSAALFC